MARGNILGGKEKKNSCRSAVNIHKNTEWQHLQQILLGKHNLTSNFVRISCLIEYYCTQSSELPLQRNYRTLRITEILSDQDIMLTGRLMLYPETRL